MPGKFLNEITADKPAKDDLGLFFDKSKNTTAQSSLVDIVAAGLDLTSGKAGEAPVVIETVNPDGTKTQSLGWAKTASSGAAAPPRPANATDLIITHDPASGTDGAATPAQVLTAGLPAGGNAGDALTLTASGLAWGSSLPASTTADKGKQLTVQVDGKVAWSSDSSDLPAYTVADKGKQLTVKADGKATEWVEDAKELPTITDGLTALQTKADKSGVEWVASVNQATNLKGGFTAGAFFPVNDQNTNATRFVNAAAFRKLAGVYENLYFPEWTPVNKQVGDGWPEMGQALSRMVAIHRSDALAANFTLSSANGAMPGDYAYYSGIVLPNGKALLIPAKATVAKLYDCTTNTFTNITGGTFPFGFPLYTGGVLLNNGKVLLVPLSATVAQLYDPGANTFSDIAGATFPGNFSYHGGVLLPNDKALLIPRKATVAKLYDPTANTFSDIAGTTFSAEYNGGVLLPNGKVLIVPRNATVAKLYDPTANTFSDIAGAVSGYSSGVLLPDGKVFLVPFTATTAKLYDYVSNTFADIAGTTFNSTYSGGVLMPSGKVLLSPDSAANVKIYDPVAGTITDVPGALPGNTAFHGCILLPNGKAMLIPGNSSTARLVDNSSPQLGTLPFNFTLSPFFNKS